MKKENIAFISLSLILSGQLLATTPTQIINNSKNKTYNEVDDKYKDESGFAFYEDRNSSNPNHKAIITSKNCCSKMLEIMSKMLKEQQEQTKIQKKILKILQDRFDPKPHYITRNGKKCIANSSADCFEMPITPAAARVPVLKNWLKNPSMKNTVKYLQWEAKYFKEIYRRGDSLPMAVEQFGSKAYPLNNYSLGFGSLKGFNIKDLKIKNIIKSTKKKYRYIIFFGINRDLDITSILNLKNLFLRYKGLDFTIVFKDKKSKEIFNDMIKSVFSKKIVNEVLKAKQLISEKAFKNYGVYTTPSVVIQDKKSKEAQIICNGKIQIGYFEQQVYNYLEYYKKLDYNKTIDYKNWSDKVDFRKEYYKDMLGIDIDKIINIKGK